MGDIAKCSNSQVCECNDTCNRALDMADEYYQAYLEGQPELGAKCEHYWKVPANPIKKNTVLYTKDGRRFSNAIVTKPADKVDDCVEFKTDYGNTVANLREKDISQYFYIGKVARSDHKHFSE